MTEDQPNLKCGDCLSPLSGAASFVWGSVLYNLDGSTHFCAEKEKRS